MNERATQVEVNSEEIRKLWIVVGRLQGGPPTAQHIIPEHNLPIMPEIKKELDGEEHTLAKSCCACLYRDDSYANKAVLCHRYPAPVSVPEARWCGEFKPTQGSE